MADEDSPLDITDYSDLEGVDLCVEEGSFEAREIATLIVRTATVTLTLVGGVWLVTKIRKSGRGSWVEALLIILIQLIWQLLAWYSRHIDTNWVFTLSCATVDSEYARKIYLFFENMMHAFSMYTGVVTILRLASVVGMSLYIFVGISIIIPLVFSVTILLLHIYMDTETMLQLETKIGIASFKVVILHIVPVGLILCWTLCQIKHICRPRKSHREVSSNIISLSLILYHMVAIAQFSVNIVITVAYDNKKLDIVEKLVDVDPALTEASYFLASLALPWSWLIGLIIPLQGGKNQLDMNLKLAKQNKQRNIIKYEKEVSKVATPPTSPYKFSPEVTSSPSVLNGSVGSLPAHHNKPDMNPTPLTSAPGKKEKRRSYQEAVSNSNLNILEEAPPRQTKSKSIDPLWLPIGRPEIKL